MIGSDLARRVLLGVVAGPLFLLALWAGEGWRHFVLLGVATLGAWESARIVGRRWNARPIEAILLALVALGWAGASPHGPWASLALGKVFVVPLLVPLLAWTIPATRPASEAFPRVLASVGIVVFFGMVGDALCHLASGPRGFDALTPLLMALGTAWVADTAAYFVGRTLGRNPLAHLTSPKKTLEGALGGCAAGILFAFFWGHHQMDLPIVIAAAWAPVLSLSALAGDLLESALKRWGGAKDSSKLLPGHGGFLDRFDSVFLVAPLLSVLVSFQP